MLLACSTPGIKKFVKISDFKMVKSDSTGLMDVRLARKDYVITF